MNIPKANIFSAYLNFLRISVSKTISMKTPKLVNGEGFMNPFICLMINRKYVIRLPKRLKLKTIL